MPKKKGRGGPRKGSGKPTSKDWEEREEMRKERQRQSMAKLLKYKAGQGRKPKDRSAFTLVSTPN